MIIFYLVDCMKGQPEKNEHIWEINPLHDALRQELCLPTLYFKIEQIRSLLILSQKGGFIVKWQLFENQSLK